MNLSYILPFVICCDWHKKPHIHICPNVMFQEEVEEEAAPVREKTVFAVKLVGFDEGKKIALIKEIKNLIPGTNLVQVRITCRWLCILYKTIIELVSSGFVHSYKQCRPRSDGFWWWYLKDQHCLLFILWTCTKNLHQVIRLLTVTTGCINF